MIKVEFLETFNTSIGVMAIVKDDYKFKLGDTIVNQDGVHYRIEAISFPTRPPITGKIGLKLQPL